MKTTRSTIKSFIEKNEGNLYINMKSSFDGMIDGQSYYSDGFQKAATDKENYINTLGVTGAWFVGSSRDYITPYETDEFKGYEVSNCCGHFFIAVKKSGI